MNGLGSFVTMLCAVGLGVGMLSMLTPQKRTKRTMSFVLGLFLLVSVVNAVRMGLSGIHLESFSADEHSFPTVGEEELNGEVMQYTASALVKAADALLRDEGIAAEDIRISLKISSDGRIYADRIVIYISESDLDRKNDIRAIIDRNFSKEPDIYVKRQEAQRADDG